MPRGAKAKTYPDDVVARVSAMYAAGDTQHEIATAVGLSQKVVWNLMRRHGLTARVAAKRNQRGAKNASWKGDRAGNEALHRRLYALYGKPCVCDVCGTKDANAYDYANLSGRYEDLTDYAAMCRSCHSKYDGKISNIRKMRRDVDAQAASA
jgi:hypothetical protein